MEPRRQAEHRYRVRFDEADAEGWLRPSGLLRYAQDMAWRHSTEAGFDRDWYERRGMNWLVRNVKVSLAEPITYGDVLAIGTKVTGWRHVWARRHTEVRRINSEDGRGRDGVVATVETDWVLLTLEGTPAKVPTQIVEYFSPGRPFKRDRIELPEPTGKVTTLATRVRPLDVDPLRHMNNAAYVDMVDDGLSHLPAEQHLEAPNCYRIGYLRAALPGTPIRIDCWPAGDEQIACRISSLDGHELAKALVSHSND